MKKIYNIWIDPRYIIGCGDLLQKTPTDPVARMYRSAKIYFEVYTRYYAVTVSTDDLSFLGEREKESQGEYEKIRNAWVELRDHLQASSLGDDPDLYLTKEE